MKKITAALLLIFVLVSCKSKQDLVAEKNAREQKSVKEIVEGHNDNPLDFTNLQIRASANYEGGGDSYSFSMDIRVKKDEMIWVNASVLGFPVAKALITPQKVSYYVNTQKEYFEGDYEILSNWLGTKLDYNKVQNMLLGRAMDNLAEGKYKSGVQDGLYTLEGKEDYEIFKRFLFEGANFLIKQQIIEQGGYEPQMLTVNYPGYKEYGKTILPTGLKAEAQKQDKVNIDIEYNSITFDKEDLRFTYNVPNGMDRIYIE